VSASPRLLIAAFAASALSAVALTGLTLDAHIDARSHASYDRALRRVVELDAQLNEQVAESYMGFVTHYDDLVRTWSHLSATADRLASVPGHLVDEQRTEQLDAVAAYRGELDEKERLLESFKTEQAILRNALRALPYSVEQLEEGLLVESRAAAARLPTLINPTLLHAVAPTPEREVSARCGLALLSGETPPGCGGVPLESAQLPAELQEMILAVRRQGEVVLERQAELEALVQSLMTLPTASLASQAADRYDLAYTEATRRADNLTRLLEVFIGLTFLLGAGLVIARTRADARALRELTERLQEAMGRLQQEREREMELVRLRSRFVSMTSHEFRTPLSVILSSINLLIRYSDRWDDARRGKHLSRIQSAGETMSKMMEQVLLIGRADAEMMDLKPQQVDVGALTREVINAIQTTVSEERKLQLSDDAPAYPLVLDGELLRHALTNLLSNAFKYSPTDSTVHLHVGGDREHICFKVSDEGIGIPAADLPNLFEPFHRGSNTADIPGTGLGLAVVKRSIDRHGGSISVDSEPGRGSCFRVRVPVLKESA